MRTRRRLQALALGSIAALAIGTPSASAHEAHDVMESAGSVAGCVMYDAVGPDDGYVTIDCWLVDTLDDGLPVYVEWRSNLQSSSPVRLYNRTGPNYGIPVSDTRDDGWVLVEWRACSDLPGDCSPWVGHVTK